MKHLFRLAVIIFFLFIITACGQQAEPQVNDISDMGTSITSTETKEVIDVNPSDEGKEGADETEEVEENSDDKDEKTTVADSSHDNQAETNSKTSTASDSSNTNRSSSDSNKQKENSKNSSSNSNNSSTNSNNLSPNDNDQDTTKQTANSKPKQDSKPKPKEKSPTPTPKSTVTVTVESPSELNGPNLAPAEIEITDGDTAFAATLRVLNKKGISIDYTGSGATAYVKSIGGLGEFDAGPLSGWNVYVEGVMIPRSSDAYEVFNGYSIHWKYTKNYLEN